jgi:hypothetical protein
MNTDKVLSEKKHNSSITACSVLLGLKPKTIEACLPMLEYINSLSDENLEIWKERNKYNAKGKETL